MTVSRPVEATYPLAPLQEGMLFDTLAAPGAGVYVEQAAAEIAGPFDAGALRGAWESVLARHDALRTAFAWDGEREPVQVVHGDIALPWEELDWRDVPDSDRGPALERFLREDRERGFDLTRAPLLRFAVIRTADRRATVVRSHHHAILDGWSAALVEHEAQALYRAAVSGEPLELPPPRPFHEHLAWLRARPLDEAREHWQRTLAGITAPTPVPLERAGAAAEGTAGARRMELSPQATQALRRAAREHRVTVATIVHGAWALVLSRFSGWRDVVFGATTSGRHPEMEGAERVVGLLMTTVPVRVRVPRSGAVASWLRDLQFDLLDAAEFGHAPLKRIKHWSELDPERPLFESLVVFESRPPAAASGGSGLQARGVAAFSRTNIPLTVVVAPGERLRLLVAHERRRVGDDAAQRIAEHLAFSLETLAHGLGGRLEDLPALPARERARLLAHAKGPRAPRGGPASVDALFERQAARTPDAPAVIGENVTSYGALAERAGRLAHRLRAVGVGPDVPVGVCLEPSADAVAAVLGVLRAGGAYLPLDPDHPRRRLEGLLASARARVVVTDDRAAERLPPGVRTVRLDDGGAGPVTRARPLAAECLAYVMFTSGSGGEPKGVMVAHRALVTRVRAMAEFLGVGPGERVLRYVPATFDASVEELFPALCSGAALVVHPSPAALAAGALLEYCEQRGVTVLHLPAQRWLDLADAIVSGSARLPATVRLVLVGGESVTTAELERWRRAVGRPVEVLHAYGPTEATVTATVHRASAGGSPSPRVPIGRPLAGTTVHVLGDDGRPVPLGATGELHIGGEALARGYLHRAGATAERFRPDPWSAEPGARLYATGDLARWRADGELEFAGRVDEQLNVRGVRIEPAEVEAALRRHPGVRGAVVVGEADGARQSRLVAYVTGEPAPEALRRSLSSALPPALVPSVFVKLAELPLTPTGKVDRRVLASAPPPAPAGVPENPAPVRDPIEEAVAEVWAQLLELPAVGAGDDFYALGGDSMLAMRAVGQIRRILDADVRLDEFLAAPTVAGVAELVRRGRGAGVERIEPATGPGPAPLSLGQEGLWRLDALLPGNHAFTMTHAARYAGPLDPDALEQALARCVRRHDVLRTTYAAPDGRPVQVVSADVPSCFFAVEVATEDEARGILRRESVRPFDLATGPVLRVVLVSSSADAHALFVAMHHIAADAWSLRLLLAELSAEYRGVRAGRPPLPRPALQYGDYARWQRAAVDAGRFDARLARGRRRFAPPLEPLGLPADHPRTEPGFATSTATLHLPPELAGAVRDFARRMGATVFMTVLTALEALLHATTGARDIRVGTVSANRSAGTEDVVGLFLNTLVVRVDAGADPSARELLARTRAAALDAFTDPDLPFELVRAGVAADVPLFEVMLVAESAPTRYLDADGVEARPLDGAGDAEPAFTATTCDVVFVLRERPDALDVVARYKVHLFRHESVAAWLERLRTILCRMVRDPDERLSRLAAADPRPTGGPRDVL